MWLSNRLISKHNLLVGSVQRRTRCLGHLLGLGLLCALFVIATLTLTKTLTTHAYKLTSLTTSTKSQAATPTTPQAAKAPTAAQIPSLATATAISSAASSVPACTPDTSYTTPSAITPLQPGLQEVIDNPSTYAVYGNSTAQITAQIAQCTPVLSTGTGGAAGRYAASTASTVSWQTDYTDTGTGLCTMDSVSVTLHINQVFPQWQPTNGSPASLTSTWQAYSAKLHAYEQGHVQLDEQAAQAVLTDLQALPATSCDAITQVANSKANADLANYLTANANYDIVNDFGSKQNVVL